MANDPLQPVMDHIEKGEGRVNRPYKIQEQLTAGVGFKVSNADAFAKLPFKVKDTQTGQMRYASDDEKRREFDRIKGMSETELKRDKNAFYLGDDDINAKLKAEAEERVDKVKKEIGSAGWDKLTDGQKATLVDIHYANPDGLKKFEKLKDAARRGDAEGMAREAGFHSGGSRNWEREARNQAAILGVSQEEGRRIVQDKFKDKKPIFDGPVAPPKKSDQGTPPPAPTPAPETPPTPTPEVKTQAEPKPEPTPAPAPETPPAPESDAKPKPEQKPEAKPEPTPETPPPQSSPTVENAPEAPTHPRVASMVQMAAAPIENPGQSALLKPVEKLTQGEMTDMINSAQGDYRGWRSGDPLKAHTYEKVQDWHVNIYGDQPQGNDGGKPIEPQPIRPIPTTVSPHTTPDGQDLWEATGQMGQQVAVAAGADGYETAVKGLQRGLNMLNQSHPLPDRSPAYGPYTALASVAEDGSYGPRTDFALKQAMARLGPDKVEEGFALGRFNTFARNAQSSGNAEGLAAATHGALGSLFRDPTDNAAPKVEGGVLQATLNRLGAEARDDWTPLKVDNWVGPKTTEAFASLLKSEDADRVTTEFGKGLGFLR